MQYAGTESKLNKICSHVFFGLKPQLASGKSQSWEKQAILNCPRAPVLSQWVMLFCLLPAPRLSSLLGLWLKTFGAPYISTHLLTSVSTLAPREIGVWEGLEYPKQLGKKNPEKGKNKTEITGLLASAKCNVSTVFVYWASRGRGCKWLQATMGVFC